MAMSPNIRRYLPFMLIGIFLLFILPQLFHKKSGTSSNTQATQTIAALNQIDKGEQAYKKAHGGYTAHLADLVPISKGLAGNLVNGIGVQLDAGAKGESFYVQVESGVLSLVRARNGATLVADRCVIVKSGSGVKCPAGTEAA
jgi:hypothetical protein